MEFSENALKEAGFCGFLTVNELLDTSTRREIPPGSGIYVVMYAGDQPPEFLKVSTAGWFKGKDPTLRLEELEARWVEGELMVYVGMSGEGPSAGLRKRIRALLRYGTGHNIGHAGGRALWQLPSSGHLVVCWRTTADGQKAAAEERRMLNEFRKRHGQLPFANAI